ncbi:putative quinol monooxygenase [Herbidospora mongoliensis]|uniref:putative quinol monooxygenase n=1 Tax=Herbidospora mongoliensis TaxID=688067 RepID=UPI0008300366|nr:antibiotic biosynthesis monooxygenase [Herbidospora mongoliensis]
MELVVAVIAFAGAILAAVTTGVLVGRIREESSGWLVAWAITTVAVCLGLGAIAIGTLLGFGPLTFRVFQVGGALLAPLWLAGGLIQLLAESRSARLGGWLLAGGLSFVGAVIMTLDPVLSGFTKTLPIGATHWDIWPEWLLRGVHGLDLLVLFVALIVALVRMRSGDDYDADNMNATVVLAPIGMAVIGSQLFTVQGIFVATLLAAIPGGIWYAVSRPLAPYDDEEAAQAPSPQQQGPPSGPMPVQPQQPMWQEQSLGRRVAGMPPPQPMASPMTGPMGSPPMGSPMSSPMGSPPMGGPPMPSTGPQPAIPPGATRSGLGDLVAEYRAGEQQGGFDYGARMQPQSPQQPPLPPDFGGPATGTLMAADAYNQQVPEYGMPLPPPTASTEFAMPNTGVLYPGQVQAQMPPQMPQVPAPATGSVRPSPTIYGMLTVFTLMDGAGDAFDKLAEDTVEQVLRNEPDTLLFVSHGVKSAPLQRLVYELYRDQTAYLDHQRQPHMERFATERQPLVLATNVIELTVNAAKVVPLPTTFKL